MDSLSKILIKQAGFTINEQGEILAGTTPCNLEAVLLIQLTVGWCLEKNRRYLFSHQASKEIKKDFGIEQSDPQQDQPRKL